VAAFDPALPGCFCPAADRRQCHELRIPNETKNWRIVYHLADDAVVILEVFEKKTPQTPPTVIATCQQRLKRYRAITQPKNKS
jgi:phage-related protein